MPRPERDRQTEEGVRVRGLRRASLSNESLPCEAQTVVCHPLNLTNRWGMICMIDTTLAGQGPPTPTIVPLPGGGILILPSSLLFTLVSCCVPVPTLPLDRSTSYCHLSDPSVRSAKVLFAVKEAGAPNEVIRPLRPHRGRPVQFFLSCRTPTTGSDTGMTTTPSSTHRCRLLSSGIFLLAR